jgi:hypothetical protein
MRLAVDSNGKDARNIGWLADDLNGVVVFKETIPAPAGLNTPGETTNEGR